MSDSTTPGTPQVLNYRAFAGDGVMALADGAYLTAFEVHGPDQEYADDLAMDALANHINRDVAKLGSGWQVQMEAIRAEQVITAGVSHCPEVTSQLLAEERAAEFAQAGTHYRTRLVLTCTWLPPTETGQALSRLLFGRRRIGKPQSQETQLASFLEQTAHIATSLGHFLQLRRLTNTQLKLFLYYCLTGNYQDIGTAPGGSMLNYAIGAVRMEPHRGMVDGRHVRVVGVHGFPTGTHPQMLDEILQLPMEVRLSQRWIPLSAGKAVKELERKRNTWEYYTGYNPKRIGWQTTRGMTKTDADQVVRRNRYADTQADSVDREITEIQAGAARGGYYTLGVVLRHDDEAEVEQMAGQVVQIVNRLGFKAVVESDNFPAAFKGTLPGHSSNVRKPRLTSDHFVRLMSYSTPWVGHEKHPSPLYPKNSGPLLWSKSTGNTPFAFTPKLHSFTIGPTEAGKTTLFNAWAMAQLQYENAQVFTIDNDAGGIVPCLAAGGEYFDLDSKKYAPLSHTDQEHEYAWAVDYCEGLAKKRGHVLSTNDRRVLAEALTALSTAPVSHRTLTGLLGQLQDETLRQVFGYYAGTEPGAIIDGAYSPLAESHWLAFDMAQVMKRSEAVRSAVLLAQLHEIERRMENGSPSALFIDESWMSEGEEILTRFIETGSATFRKKVVSVHLVLHSPSDLDAYPHKGRLLNNIQTKILLPNAEADTPAVRPYYEGLGVGRRVITKLATDMIPRRHYHVIEGTQQRTFELPWGKWAQALFGVNGRDHKDRILELRAQHGELWLPEWLTERGHSDLATQWQGRTLRKEAA